MPPLDACRRNESTELLHVPRVRFAKPHVSIAKDRQATPDPTHISKSPPRFVRRSPSFAFSPSLQQQQRRQRQRLEQHFETSREHHRRWYGAHQVSENPIRGGRSCFSREIELTTRLVCSVWVGKPFYGTLAHGRPTWDAPAVSWVFVMCSSFPSAS